MVGSLQIHKKTSSGPKNTLLIYTNNFIRLQPDAIPTSLEKQSLQGFSGNQVGWGLLNLRGKVVPKGRSYYQEGRLLQSC